MAALAVVLMTMGGLIPVATFVCPTLCMLLLQAVLRFAGKRIAWAWYLAVSLLCLLLGPDKEAVFLFLFLGWYPIAKPRLEKLPLAILWKLLAFNAAVLLMYRLLIGFLGMDALEKEFAEMGLGLLLLTLLLGNITFALLDKVLSRVGGKR